jgi:crossover junction endodeoxyribonuclease RuvC
LQSIANEFQKTLLFWKPDVAVIEGYGNTPKMGVSSFVTVVEVATLLRLSLFQSQIAWIEVPPTTLKKWTTGNGNAKKPDMALAVEQKWNFKNGNDDIIDAYALARLGQVEPEQLFKLKGVQLVDGAKKIA